MKSKIILTYPKLLERNTTQEYHWLPINQLFLAAPLINKGFEVRVLDERRGIIDDFDKTLLEEAADASIVGVSAYTGFQIKPCLRIIKLVKEKFPHIKIVWGGPHASVLPEQVLQNHYVDIVVKGQGEIPLLEIAQGKDLEDIKGIGFKKNGKMIFTEPNERFDINKLPNLPFELLDIKKYINPQTQALNYIASWGCEGNCTFCYWDNKSGHKWVGFSIERILTDLKYLKDKYGIKIIKFHDSCSTFDKNWLVGLAQGLIDKEIGLSWNIQGRADEFAKFDKNEIDILSKSGLNSISFGVESGSPRILRLMCKQGVLDQMVKSAEILKEYPIKLFLYLIFAVPTEQIEDLVLTRNFVDKLMGINQRVYFQTAIFTPLPKIPLTVLGERLGFSPPTTLEEWSGVWREERFQYKPWFTKEFNEEYFKKFYELFPETDGYVTQLSK